MLGMTINERMYQAAMTYFRSGWKPMPLCNPDASGRCGCGRRHEAREVGKAPMVGAGWQNVEVDRKQVEVWWQSSHVGANIGLLLAPSELLVVDLDGEAAIAEAERNGLPDTLRARTRKGYHYYYKRPAGCAVRRATQRGESGGIDVLTNGYVVAAPSRHASGVVYEWDGLFCPFLSDPPQWALDILTLAAGRSRDGDKPTWMIDVNLERTDGIFDRNDSSKAKLVDALQYVDSDEYRVWIRVGMALKQWDDCGNGGGSGFELWVEWSANSSKFPGRDTLAKRWKSFRRRDVAVGTIFCLARDHGWEYDHARINNAGDSPSLSRNLGSWFCG